MKLTAVLIVKISRALADVPFALISPHLLKRLGSAILRQRIKLFPKARRFPPFADGFVLRKLNAKASA